MKSATLVAALALAAALAAPALAQIGPGQPPLQPNPSPLNPYAPPAVSSAPAPAVSLGKPLSVSGGPWVLGETLFFSQGRVVSDYAWRDKLRGLRGQLYSAQDLQADVQTLQGLNVFNRVAPAVFEIPNDPIPPQFTSIAVSTNQVRVVFDVDLKGSTEPVKPRLVTPPSAVSGVMLTPTAFRGVGRHNTPGLGLDFNALYVIGRLYGKNDYPNAPERTNYIDRIGLWLLQADGKMQIQSDLGWRPAVAVGGQGTLMFRDSGQPNITAPTVTAKVNAKSTRVLGDAYIVASKEIHKVRTSVGVMQGNIGDLPANLTEFLAPEALVYYKHNPSDFPSGVYPPQSTFAPTISRTIPFGSVLYLIKPDYPVGFEVMKFNGAYGNPMLINFKLGRFLHLNFDVGYLKFQGGYDLLGMFQFRYNHFPKD